MYTSEAQSGFDGTYRSTSVICGEVEPHKMPQLEPNKSVVTVLLCLLDILASQSVLSS